MTPFCSNCGGDLDCPADPFCLYPDRHSSGFFRRDQNTEIPELIRESDTVKLIREIALLPGRMRT